MTAAISPRLQLHPAHAERRLLCDLFDDLGPTAPTLCGVWTTSDLAAHLLVRKTRPDAAVGLVVAAAHGWTEKVETRLLERIPYPVVVRRLRCGPPTFAFGALPGIGPKLDLHEWFVHHEDVRRAAGLEMRPDSGQQRTLDDAIWGVLPIWAARLSKQVKGIGLVLVSEDGRRRRVRKTPIGAGWVELHGRPSEMLFALFNRRDHAVYEAVGSDADVATWNAAPLGL